MSNKVLELFEEGKRFTEDLLKENEKLRLVIAKLKNEVKQVESQYVQVDVPRLQQRAQLLEEEVVELRKENQELREQFTTIEEENREFADRYVQVERQNSDLISMYVASYRLHSTLDYDEVMSIVKEIVINMVGAETFGIYLIDEHENRLVRIASEGLPDDVEDSVPLGHGPIGEAAEAGAVFVAPDGTDLQQNTGNPIACIPLKVGERVMGIIAIYQLLLQKEGFESVDFELFELLGGHAATAIYVSKLYSLSERKRNTLQGFIDLLKNDVGGSPDGA